MGDFIVYVFVGLLVAMVLAYLIMFIIKGVLHYTLPNPENKDGKPDGDIRTTLIMIGCAVGGLLFFYLLGYLFINISNYIGGL